MKTLWLAICAAALLFAGCQSSPQTATPDKAFNGPDQEGWNSKVTVTNSGRITAIVQYGHMAKYSKDRRVLFDQGVMVDFYGRKGEHTSSLTSTRGILYENSNDVEALGNVVVVSDSGMTLRTEKLRWLNQRERIVSEEFVTITTARGDTLHGHGFESDATLKLWSIHKLSGISKKKVNLPGR
ncbi:MAG: LPS export ABC transporter periplasmic protein LptC [candidate division KSB1 bacterium]|nr:LPS export ABC transporter periplasmic protein LptC [candidate division KSB1 bacterium]MDZ7276054.1 LPS export ABC transporter periplasmic protein LptC [candidate division KSB1 bacterium]MDZ7285664.1 LPS export ABC transporter periplasmic protein LptC [candidate division KSB1 bacterium]MDZ7298696.1 LPS export ABC transporter periplasmic protein LptC [candidate division KSB1 bacterium]MDZ7307555.1 LPS export ABC transporter periplasmic protein LptC [candidate division KSB1 bacterium]